MEFKKKTIIWEDNNEPPKDYIWAKKDGKFYEYSYATRSWIESKLIKAEESGESGNSGKSERFTLADLFMEIKKTQIEETEKSQGITFPGEVLYPDTFVVDSGNGGYRELPRTAAFPFLTSMDNLVNAISAYTNPPTISDNTWASQKFMSNLRNISSGFHAVSIVTEDGTSEGGYPPRELYILANNSDIG